jgi:pyruvate dehydrogenase E2 component (dihydrolipoamide acetyltransferase)
MPASEAPQVAAQHEQRTTSKPARPDKIVSKEEELKGALEALRSRGKVQPSLNGREPLPPAGSNGQRIFASPVARRIAGDAGLDLATIPGSGPGGRIVRADVEQAVARGVAPATVPAQPAAPPAPQAAPGEARPLSRMRRAIARKMVESKQQIPHFYVTSAILMDEVLAFRKRLNEGLSKEESISVTDLIIKAAALALTRFPDLYASFGGESINYSSEVNVSVAVALDEGLVAPVLRDCGSRSVGAISRDLKAAVERARAGKTQPQELEGGNFTVSNLGMFDVEEFIAIITAPQASALAIASTRQEPVVRNGEIAIASVMRATISVDHRVSDGAYAARYLQELKGLLENPLRLML